MSLEEMKEYIDKILVMLDQLEVEGFEADSDIVTEIIPIHKGKYTMQKVLNMYNLYDSNTGELLGEFRTFDEMYRYGEEE